MFLSVVFIFIISLPCVNDEKIATGGDQSQVLVELFKKFVRLWCLWQTAVDFDWSASKKQVVIYQ